MTYQIKELLYVDEKKYNFREEPLDQYPSLSSSEDFEAMHTACHRRYIGTWQIIDDLLYLVDIEAKYHSGKKVNLQNLFETSDKIIHAKWFTGKLSLSHFRYPSSIEFPRNKEVEMSFINGVISPFISYSDIFYNLNLNLALHLLDTNKEDLDNNYKELYLQAGNNNFAEGNFDIARKNYEKVIVASDIKIKTKLYKSYYGILKHYHGFHIPEVLCSTDTFKNLNGLKQQIIKKAKMPVNFDSDEVNFLNMKIYDSDDIFEWGKYKGLTFYKVLKKGDIDYVFWCVINLIHFCIPKYVFIYNIGRASKHFDQAFRINYIKLILLSDFPTTIKEKYESYLLQKHKRNNNVGNDWSDVAGSYDSDDMATAYWNLD